MRFFPPSLEIGDEEGFTPEKDIFQRADFGAGLTNLVSISEDPLVIMLDSPWGTGKTTFIKMWAGELRKCGFPVVYFDAFANDHLDDAFIAVAAEVVRLSIFLKKTKTPAYKNYLKKAARAGSLLLRTGAKVGVKAATLGAIDASDFDALKNVADDIARETSTKADQYVEMLLKLQSRDQQTLDSLRNALSELAKTFAVQDPHSPRPLIFIVDELDHCRPTFALELLEKIKHVFSTPNVQFVLVTHLHQLENSVRYSYGKQIDARTYLEKFYNLMVHFPEQPRYDHERFIPKYMAYLRGKLSLSGDDVSLIQQVAEARELSLRTVERIVSYVTLAKSFTPKNFLWLDPIVLGLCVTKVLDPELFRRARSGRISVDEVRSVLAVGKWPPSSRSNWVMEWWTFCLAEKESDYPQLNWAGFQQSLFRYNINERSNIVAIMAGHLDRLQLPKSN